MFRPNVSFCSGAGVCAPRIPANNMTTKNLVILNFYKNWLGACAPRPN